MELEPVYTNEEVVFYDTDSGGVVSNIAYLRYVEKARCHLFASLGMELEKMTETQVFPTVVRTEIDYKMPAKLGEKIVVAARVESIEKIRVHCHFRIYRANDDSALFAEAKQCVVLVRMPEGKPVRPPETWK